ncbi:MAG: nuclear transport factor 2 family protein [Desulfurellaceae bacterium]|nr:nuclear transport factor 2 family protein [Desulfurellaceae bacterium]
MNLEDIAQRVQTLEDVEAIKKLKARYCAGADERDEDKFVGCFTEDAVWDGGNFGHYEGKAAIREFFGTIPQVLSFAIHYVMNPRIEVNGDTATGYWYLLEPCTMLEGGEQAVWGVAKYEEEYVREDGEWKIRNLILAPECWTPFEQGWVNQQFIGQ